MTNAETTVLYALSTLAQTCAALAAFVGAVGLYRLQVLREQRREVERDLRGIAAHPHVLAADVAARLPFKEILDGVQTASEGRGGISDLARDTLTRWRTALPLLGRSQRALVLFEAWNLLVIFAALVGFNHVPELAACPWTLRALWPVALVTAGVTGYCVFVWTRE